MEIADKNTVEGDPTLNISVENPTQEKEMKILSKKKPGVKPIEIGKYIKESEEKIAALRFEAQNEDLNK